MALRPYWSGQIRLSLVSLSVNIYAALNRSRQIAMHEVYKPTGKRVHHQKVVDGEPIETKDIVKGYEVEKGEYVLIDPNEIKDLKIPSSKTLEIKEFVPADSIDPIYCETPYFVAPDGKSAEASFNIIREALRQTHKIGLGQLAIAGRERLCALRPCGNGILLETLRYEEELKESDPYFEDIHSSKMDKEELDLAKELIKRKTATFKPEKFHDHYREALQALIEAKQKHQKPKLIFDEEPKTNVVNLMDALRKSLREKDQPEPEPEAKPRAKKKAARRRKAA
jgi:DNA end-binding protein Ku